MAANTTIEWATKSWNPVRGCSRVSSGCDSCYAMKFAHRFSGAGKPYEGLTTIRKGKVDWSGVARGSTRRRAASSRAASRNGKYRTAFEYTWGELHGWTGPESFNAEPEVVRIAFERVTEVR